MSKHELSLMNTALPTGYARIHKGIIELPDAELLQKEFENTRRLLESRIATHPAGKSVRSA